LLVQLVRNQHLSEKDLKEILRQVKEVE